MTRSFCVLALCLWSSLAHADVISTTGNIHFSPNEQDSVMTLNSTGLGIGIAPSANLHVSGNTIVSTQVFVGDSISQSNLNLSGTFAFTPQLVSANTTLGDHSLVLVDSASDDITLILPYAANVTGRQVQIKKTSTLNSVWIKGGGNLMDNTSLIEMPVSGHLASIKLVSNGSQWFVLEHINTCLVVAADNLVGWWKLDESSGSTAKDSSGYGFDATTMNTDFATSGNTNGKFHRAIDLNGVDQHLDAGDQALHDMSSHDTVTVSAWVYRKGGQPNGNVSGIAGRFDWTPTTNREFSLGWYNSAGYVFEVSSDGAATTTLTSGVHAMNEWIHVVGLADGANLKIYVNGALINTAAYAGIHHSTATFKIGVVDDNGGAYRQYFNGVIDDVRLFNRALTDAEVLALYQHGL